MIPLAHLPLAAGLALVLLWTTCILPASRLRAFAGVVSLITLVFASTSTLHALLPPESAMFIATTALVFALLAVASPLLERLQRNDAPSIVSSARVISPPPAAADQWSWIKGLTPEQITRILHYLNQQIHEATSVEAAARRDSAGASHDVADECR